ncbi:MAG: hypothetical protein F6K17_41840, partial [Okeania sp. SIO3C4]|nr:hypothetical protein [Okeania sp. SIO3C4]
MTVAPDQIDRIVWNQHHDPFEILGPHPIKEGDKVFWSIRAYLPEADNVSVILPDERTEQ